MSPKRKPKQHEPIYGTTEKFELGDVFAHQDLPPGRTLPRGSKYDALFEKVLALRPGEVLSVKLDSSEGDYNKQKGRISRALFVTMHSHPHYVSVRDTVQDWTIGIYCYEAEWIGGVKKKSRKKAKKRAKGPRKKPT